MVHDPADAALVVPASDAETVHAPIGSLIPGIVLCAFIAAVALALRGLSGLSALSPMIVAISAWRLFSHRVSDSGCGDRG